MSVLIKGLDMPTGNHEIIVRIQSDGRVLDQWGHRLNQEFIAVPIPPHWDLIDRDALKNKHHWTDDFYETEYVEVEDIDDAPTIIPASGGNEDE